MTTNHRPYETQDAYGRPTAKALADILSRSANSFSSARAFNEVAELLRADHRTLQQAMAGFAMQMIVAFAKNGDEGWVDGRNEFSVALCQKLRDVLKEEGMIRSDGELYQMPCI